MSAAIPETTVTDERATKMRIAVRILAAVSFALLIPVLLIPVVRLQAAATQHLLYVASPESAITLSMAASASSSSTLRTDTSLSEAFYVDGNADDFAGHLGRRNVCKA
jgi:hypothetical protein